MEKDTKETPTVFRVDKSGIVFAMFPYQPETNNTVMGYEHVGQHSTYDYHWSIKTSQKATPEQYEPLKKELEGLGYKIWVVSKKSRNSKIYLN